MKFRLMLIIKSGVSKILHLVLQYKSMLQIFHQIEIQAQGTDEKYVFNVNRWLNSNDYDGSNTIELETDFWAIIDQLVSQVVVRVCI